MTPYQNMYPFSITGGWGGRLFSSFIAFGRFDNRAFLVSLRHAMLFAPAGVLAMIMLFQPDWYQMMATCYWAISRPMPQWAQEKYAVEMNEHSRNKPGQMMKHHYGGAVSIPGSEKFVTEM
uniref:Uncharacterized protein n=1 Tax=Lygus hesperus TaxID=30085 RepID=A0A146L117_LYGHE